MEEPQDPSIEQNEEAQEESEQEDYEAPAVEQADTEDGPSTTAAGASGNGVITPP